MIGPLNPTYIPILKSVYAEMKKSSAESGDYDSLHAIMIDDVLELISLYEERDAQYKDLVEHQDCRPT